MGCIGKMGKHMHSLKELSALLSQNTLILANFNFRMASNMSLNATCNLDGYLFCKVPAGALEVEVKVKTTWEKFNMVQDIHTRTEKTLHVGEG